MSELINELKINNQRIFDTGHNQGLTDVIEKQEAFLTNKPQTYYDAFWDAYQGNGTKKDYGNAFAGSGWTTTTFKPKYNINVGDGYMIFRYNPMNIDLVKYLDELGVTLDFSNCNRTQYGFNGSKFTRVGVIDVRKVNGSLIDAMFSDCRQLKTIDLMKVATTTNMNCFSNCTALENITIEGTIGKNVNFQWSTKLSKASIESIINALSTTTEGLTITLSQTAVNNAFETAKGAADGSTSAEWIALAGNENTEGIRPNWTISLM